MQNNQVNVREIVSNLVDGLSDEQVSILLEALHTGNLEALVISVLPECEHCACYHLDSNTESYQVVCCDCGKLK